LLVKTPTRAKKEDQRGLKKSMLKKTVFFFIVILVLTDVSCKKYPDGPLFDLHSKGERILGEWDVNYFSIDGYDSTSYLKNQPYYGHYHFELERNTSPIIIKGGHAIYHANDKNYQSVAGQWGLTNNKMSIYISFTFNSTYRGHLGPYRFDVRNTSGNTYFIWDIMRLAQHELWLQGTYNNKVYFVKFNNV